MSAITPVSAIGILERSNLACRDPPKICEVAVVKASSVSTFTELSLRQDRTFIVSELCLGLFVLPLVISQLVIQGLDEKHVCILVGHEFFVAIATLPQLVKKALNFLA
jgi:hypothetical protein